MTGIDDPGAARIRERLSTLEAYPWSSWRVYAGSERPPKWLSTGVISGGCGGRTISDKRRALREYTEAPIREGRLYSPWDRVVGGLVLGSQEFVSRVLHSPEAKPADDETQAWSARTLRPDWASIVKAAEKLSGQRWSETVTAHGNWIRDAVLFATVRYLGFRLAEVYREIPGLKYPAAATAVRRFAQVQSADPERARFVGGLKRALKQ